MSRRITLKKIVWRFVHFFRKQIIESITEQIDFPTKIVLLYHFTDGTDTPISHVGHKCWHNLESLSDEEIAVLYSLLSEATKEQVRDAPYSGM